MTFRIRENPALVQAIRTALRDEHPTLPHEVERYAERTQVPPERVWEKVENAVFDAVDRVGRRYAGEMAAVVEHMTRVRGELTTMYEGVFGGRIDPSGPARLRSLIAVLHEDLEKLTDPATWMRRRRRGAGPAGRYPGARPELVGGPSNAPRENTPVGATGQRWKRRVVSLDEIVPDWDPVERTLYWRFPDLPEGVVLEFESGYRVWRHPGGAIEEEIVVGPSQSRHRRSTRGEEAIMRATDIMNADDLELTPEELSKAMHRAHGAGAPGLGMDATYGVASAPRRLNLVFENAGVETWVRALRDNHPAGVDYLYRTTTEFRGAQTLAARTYHISATFEGHVYDMYEFTITVEPGGTRGEHVHFDVESFRAFADAERFTAPENVRAAADLRARQDAARAAGTKVPRDKPAEAVEPPAVLREALERAARQHVETVDPALTRASERLAALRTTVDDRLLAAAGEGLDPRQPLTAPQRARYQAIDALTTVLERIGSDLDEGPVDTAKLTALADALQRFNQRAARWPGQVSAAAVREFARELQDVLEANR